MAISSPQSIVERSLTNPRNILKIWKLKTDLCRPIFYLRNKNRPLSTMSISSSPPSSTTHANKLEFSSPNHTALDSTVIESAHEPTLIPNRPSALSMSRLAPLEDVKHRTVLNSTAKAQNETAAFAISASTTRAVDPSIYEHDELQDKVVRKAHDVYHPVRALAGDFHRT